MQPKNQSSPLPKRHHLLRLLKLAKHLRRGKLGHKKFNFARFNADEDGEQMESNGCGFSGCAVGEMPFVAPKRWKWARGHARLRVKVLSPDDCTIDFHSAMQDFGLNIGEANHLFIPRQQKTDMYGGRVLAHRAPKEAVASNIEIFVARRAKALGISVK